MTYGFIGGLEEGLDFAWFVIEANGKVLGEVFTSEEARDQLGGRSGSGRCSTRSPTTGSSRSCASSASSASRWGIFNLLPIPPLDGGHILFALLEKAKGSPLSRTTYERASFVGLALVLVVFVFALQNDIGRITGEGFQLNR